MSKLQEMKRNNKIGLLRFYDHEAAVLTVKKIPEAFHAL